MDTDCDQRSGVLPRSARPTYKAASKESKFRSGYRPSNDSLQAILLEDPSSRSVLLKYTEWAEGSPVDDRAPLQDSSVPPLKHKALAKLRPVLL